MLLYNVFYSIVAVSTSLPISVVVLSKDKSKDKEEKSDFSFLSSFLFKRQSAQ